MLDSVFIQPLSSHIMAFEFLKYYGNVSIFIFCQNVMGTRLKRTSPMCKILETRRKIVFKNVSPTTDATPHQRQRQCCATSSNAKPVAHPRTAVVEVRPLSSDMIDDLPEDVQYQILALLHQRELARLSASCKTLNRLADPLLWRVFRCVSCSHHLLHPRNLLTHSTTSNKLTSPSSTCSSPTSVIAPPPPPPPSKPSRATDFLELRRDAEHSLKLDSRRGAANFHVLRHLRQTVFRNVRFPVAKELQAVRALRCPQCDVFVGFRHDGVAGLAREYLHRAFVELVDSSGHVVSLQDGSILHPGNNSVTVSRCAQRACKAQLFDADDILPWTHVLASSRLTDMNPYLEWDHSWAGAGTASHPAFFVKRLRQGSYELCNVRVEHLRQGCMQVGDVHCTQCHSHIGWKLLAEVPTSTDELLHNYDQIGRFGIIRNAVTPTQPLRNVIM